MTLTNKQNPLRRRTVLAAMAGTGAVAAFPAPALSQGRRELKLVATWTAGNLGYSTSVRRLAKRIHTAAGGRIAIKIYWAGEMVSAFESFDAVSRGDADLYHASEQYWFARKSPGYAFFGSLPFGMTTTEHRAWMEFMGGRELWEELSARFHIMPLPVGDSGVQMGGWYTKEIQTLDDLRGLRCRVPGIYADMLERLGAIPVSLSGGKILPAFKEGKIDAAEWVGPWPDKEMGFHEVAKYYYWPGIHSPSSLCALGVNRSVWESLTKSQQQIFRLACIQEYRDLLEDYYAQHSVVLQDLIANHGVALRQFPSGVLAGIGRAAGEVIAESVQGDELLGRIYASFMDARTRLLRWAKFGEESYLTARRLPFRYSPPRSPGAIRPKPIEAEFLAPAETAPAQSRPGKPEPEVTNSVSRI